MKVALAQINSTLGAFFENAAKILAYMERAKDRRADLVIFPELALFGYLPNDLLERKTVVTIQWKELLKIHKAMPPGMAALVGAVEILPSRYGHGLRNVAVWLEKGKKPKIFAKQILPDYDIFDESRYFDRGETAKNIITYKKKKILVSICEDLWTYDNEISFVKYEQQIPPLKKQKISLFVNMSASPFYPGKFSKRLNLMTRACKDLNADGVYVNMCGAQDEVIFDGGSFSLTKKGKVLSRATFLEEDLVLTNFMDSEGEIRKDFFAGSTKWTQVQSAELLRLALVTGIRDFVAKTGHKKIHLGLSGGIDSALVACLAVDALGPSNVKCIALPTKYNAQESFTLAKKLSENLGCALVEIPIQKNYESLLATLGEALPIPEFHVTHENLQSRLRGVILMAIANLENSLLLATGNKSEYATGYSTLYGDMCGGLAVIADLLKHQVYELSRHYNREHEVIPQRIIERAPSAELRPNQKDQDSLPPYEELDPMVEKLVVLAGEAKTENEKWLLDKLYKTEFKRWQAPPVLKVSRRAFGKGRRYPIAHKTKN
jgi:NAD+ synthase (glutamine-hydrolysing)